HTSHLQPDPASAKAACFGQIVANARMPKPRSVDYLLKCIPLRSNLIPSVRPADTVFHPARLREFACKKRPFSSQPTCRHPSICLNCLRYPVIPSSRPGTETQAALHVR